MSKKWIDLDGEIERLGMDEDYIYVNLGIQTVDPSLIVALSRELDQDKLDRLRESISSNGWQDIAPSTLNLLLMPDGKYAVDSGGNHRAVVSNELGIKEIRASIGTCIHKSSFYALELEHIENNNGLLRKLYREIRQTEKEEVVVYIDSEITRMELEIDRIKLNAYERSK
ncbi:MAG: hypothetical protein ACQEXX_01350 [Bacillota bacterium]